MGWEDFIRIEMAGVFWSNILQDTGHVGLTKAFEVIVSLKNELRILGGQVKKSGYYKGIVLWEGAGNTKLYNIVLDLDEMKIEEFSKNILIKI